jgi:hypothetical protein
LKTFAFEIAHGYKVFRCIAKAENEKEITDAVNNGTFEILEGFQHIREFDLDDLTEGYELLDIWE